MTSSESFEKKYRLKVIFVFSVLVLVLLNRLLSHSLFYSMHQPVFQLSQDEFFYRIFLGLCIPQVITSSPALSIVFDVLLFAMPLLFLLTRRLIFAVLTFVFLLIYFFTCNVATGHHYHGLVGALIVTIPFWTKKENRFNLLWKGARCYWLYIFASAALWKIFRGTVFYQEQLSNILKSQQLDLLLQQPDSSHAQLVQYLIANPQVSHWVLAANVLVQLCFAVGFFTKKFDSVLFILAIVFCIANYFVMSIVSAELLILNLTLLNWEKVAEWLPVKSSKA